MKQLIRATGVPRSVLAKDSGLSPRTLDSWQSKGAMGRSPTPESLERFARGLEKRAARLQAIANEVRTAAADELEAGE